MSTNANASELRTLNEGVREVVSKERALEFITEWDCQFDEQSAEAGANGITTIVLAGKSYKPDAAEILMEYFKSKRSQELSTVKEIDISDIIASLPEEEGLATLKLICDGLTKVCGSSLETLDLSDNAMGLKGINACQAFYNTPMACPKLHTLRFCNLGLAEASMEELIMYLSKEEEADASTASNNNSIASRLQRIEFTKNMSGDGGCYAFAKLVSKANPSLLSYLNFSGTRASRAGTMAVITALKQRMIDENTSCDKKLWNITHLNFNDNAFGGNVGEGGELLVEILRHCPNLEYLNIHDNFLDGPTITIQHVCDALLESQCPLQFLDVGANEVTYDIVKRGLIPLLKAKASTLTTLLAETNEMTSRGVERFAKTIENLSDCVLEEINFNFNMVGGQGASAWTQLKHNGKCPPTLKKLHFDGNMIPEEHARALEDAFGDILVEMTENEPEEDADDDLSELEEDESDNEEEDVVIGGMDIIHQADMNEAKEPVELDTPAEQAAVDDLAAAMEKTNI